MSTPNEYTDNFKSNSTCIFLSVRTKLNKTLCPRSRCSPKWFKLCITSNTFEGFCCTVFKFQMILIFVFLVTILCQSGCPSLKAGLIWRLTRAPHPLLMTEIWMGEKNSLRRHWRQFHARPRSVARNWLRVERENHKIDVTERYSRCLCSYTHIQKTEC